MKNDDRSKFSNLSNSEKKLGIAHEILYLFYALAVTSYLFKRSFHAKDIFCSSENSMLPVCKHIMKVRGDQKGGWGRGGGGQWDEDRGKFENLFVLRSILMTEK